ALLMNFVLLIHPLVKTYVTYNKEHFYFIIKSFDYYQKREKYRQNFVKQIQHKKEITISYRQRATTNIHEEQLDKSSSIRKSHSFSDLLSSTISIGNENDTFNNRRINSSNVSKTISPSKTFHIESNKLGNNECFHNIDYLSTGILK